MSERPKIPTRHVIVGLVMWTLLGMSFGMTALRHAARPEVALLVGVFLGCLGMCGWLTGGWRANIPKRSAARKPAP